ncbi:hypothetical protein BDP27DRAFT_1265006 [Rhodocollybia butyracea]|uniref:Nephrocystin 3-like N-terminal domain-containing protein n=1 Tax=Rhodocollybia butyracea TaxID=206335 RepID=A0A9P5PWU6_9AGAR|nr:hypothetical protein BDP27DRAFT_1265006 [Rhodocollybia butyracea]
MRSLIFVVSKGLEILSQKVVFSASHNAEQRFPPPKCHPGTRAHFLDTLGEWVRSKSKPTSIYWLYGAAGVGKSAIAQTISESCSTSNLAASFFFSRTDSAGLRSTLSHFFITLAYQLAISPLSSPILNRSITRVAYSRPDIIQASLETQFQELIVRPCSQLSPDQLNILPRLIVIDGLDECIDIASQERLLSIIRQAKSADVQPPFPFEFLICSRPEPRIQNAFRHEQFHLILDCTELGDSFQSGVDIAKYLKDEFSMIRQDHGPTMAHVAQDWPGDHIIQQLVHRACGQFVYAATVLKYVGDYHALPTEQLKIILNVTVPEHSDSPYPDLDLLYMLILNSAIDEQNYQITMSILSYIVFCDRSEVVIQVANPSQTGNRTPSNSSSRSRSRSRNRAPSPNHIFNHNRTPSPSIRTGRTTSPSIRCGRTSSPSIRRSRSRRPSPSLGRGTLIYSDDYNCYDDCSPLPSPFLVYLGQVSCEMLENLFSLNKGKVGALLFGLHSVLNIPAPSHQEIGICHASFEDFLTDSRRSGRYFVDTSDEAMAEQQAFYFLRRISNIIEDILSGKVNLNFEVYSTHYKSTYPKQWYKHCSQKVNLPSERLFVALDQIDTRGLVSATWKKGDVLQPDHGPVLCLWLYGNFGLG